jgi:hypothetical protein
MIDVIGQTFLEFVCYGTGEVILRFIPRSFVRSALSEKPRMIEVVIRGRRKKKGRFTYYKHLKKTEQLESEKAWSRSSDGAFILSADLVALLGLLFWVIVCTAAFLIYQN